MISLKYNSCILSIKILLVFIVSAAFATRGVAQVNQTRALYYNDLSLNESVKLVSDVGLYYGWLNDASRFNIDNRYEWLRLHARSRGDYLFNDWLTGSVALLFELTLDDEGNDLYELRLSPMVKMTLPEMFGVRLVNRFMVDTRWLNRYEVGTNTFEPRFRYKLGTKVPLDVLLNRAYVVTGVETNFNFGPEVDSVTLNRVRGEIGLGKTVKENLKIELLYWIDQSRAGVDDSYGSNSLFILNFRHSI